MTDVPFPETTEPEGPDREAEATQPVMAAAADTADKTAADDETTALPVPDAPAEPAEPDAEAVAVPGAAPVAAPVAVPEPVPVVEPDTEPDVPEPEGREVEAKFAVARRSAVQDLIQLEHLADGYVLDRGRLVEITDTYYDTLDYTLLRAGIVFRLRQIDEKTKVALKGLQRTGYGPIHSRMEIEGTLARQAPPLDPMSWPEAVQSKVAGIAGLSLELAPVVMLEQSRHLRNVRRAGSPADGAGAEPGSGTETGTATEPGAKLGTLSALDAAAEPPGRPAATPPHRVATTNRAEEIVGELSVERVTVLDPDRAGVRHGALELVARFAELEFELLPGGNEDDLETVVEALEQLDDLESVTESKFERSLSLSASHPPGHGVGVFGIQSNMAMPEAGRLMWRQQLTDMLLNEAGARSGDDIEYVHDMRVATRRARAAAKVFGAQYDKSVLKPFMKSLQATGRALGPVRDLDVALHKLDLQRLDASPEDADQLDSLADEWRAARAPAYDSLLEWLDGREYRRFIADFSLFCGSPGFGVKRETATVGIKPAPKQVRHVMPVEILKRFEAVRCYETLFERGLDVPVEALHALRIDCKRLRYSIEPVRLILDSEGEKLIKQLKALQDHLGDLNDAVVAHERLLGMLADGQDGAALERQLAVQEATMVELRAGFPDVLSAYVAPANRRLLMRALARL